LSDLAILLTLILAAGCNRTLSAPRVDRVRQTMPSASVATSVVRAGPSSAGSAPAAIPVLEAAPNPDEEPECKRVASLAPPTHDVPTPDEQPRLSKCDSEALYYGIESAQNFAAARKCAYSQIEHNEQPVFGGAGILMMIYANGKGVSASFDLALKFACEFGGAPAELGARVAKLVEARKQGKLNGELGICDDATSGLLAGFCAAHDERIAAVTRGARKRRAISGLPAAAVATLERAARAFFDSRTYGEVDLTGTARGAFAIAEQANLEDDYVSGLEKLRAPTFIPPAAGATLAERKLNDTYTRLMKCKKSEPAEQRLPGSVTADGIRKTQRLWLAYRDAWLALAAQLRPETNRDAWKAWLTEQRTRMLSELGSGC